MVYTFKLISEAFDAIVNKEKSVEVRFKKNRNIKKGDYIRFVELNGNRKTLILSKNLIVLMISTIMLN